MKLKIETNKNSKEINYCCPVCKANAWKSYLVCKDYLVSEKEFELIQCTNCNFIATHNRPEEDQISHYYQAENYISHSDTQKGLINKIYHLARNWALKQKIGIVKKHINPTIDTKNIKVLDIGCGTGYFLAQCNKQDWQLYGVEPDPKAAKLALSQNQSAQIYSQINDSALTDGFDAITMWHVLEHVYQLEQTLNLIHNKTKPKGTLTIAVPNPASMDAGYYQSFWAAYDVPRHVSHFRPETLQILVERFGFVLEKKYPMYLDAFYIAMLSEKYKNKSASLLGFIKAFVLGCRSNLSAMQSTNYSSVVYVFRKV